MPLGACIHVGFFIGIGINRPLQAWNAEWIQRAVGHFDAGLESSAMPANGIDGTEP